MQINIQSIHFTASADLEDFVQRRIEKLASFHDGIVTADVYLKEDESMPGEDKCSEVKLQLPGHTLFSKACKKSFEEATDTVVEGLRKQILRQKERMMA